MIECLDHCIVKLGVCSLVGGSEEETIWKFKSIENDIILLLHL